MFKGILQGNFILSKLHNYLSVLMHSQGTVKYYTHLKEYKTTIYYTKNNMHTSHISGNNYVTHLERMGVEESCCYPVKLKKYLAMLQG